MTHRLVILGAAGDLTARYVLPALARLHEAKKLPPGLSILGVARDEWDTETFRRHIVAQLERHATHVSRSSRDAVTAALEYRRADITSQCDMAHALGQRAGPLVAYLALPPAVFAPAIASLAGMDLGKDSQVVIEKPFGENLASAQALNRLLHETFPEHAVDPRRGTETFAQVRLSINNWRWAGVPFILRSGKALGRERKEMRSHATGRYSPFWATPHPPQ